ncbi:MAG: hypothetical protein WC975_16240 [Phycisphaerae bacterium]
MHGDFPEKLWYFYDNTEGNIVLKHPYQKGMEVPCPYCGKLLAVENYRAQCCNQQFKTGFWEIRQIEPVGKHQKTQGRGWQSLRPYKP